MPDLDTKSRKGRDVPSDEMSKKAVPVVMLDAQAGLTEEQRRLLLAKHPTRSTGAVPELGGLSLVMDAPEYAHRIHNNGLASYTILRAFLTRLKIIGRELTQLARYEWDALLEQYRNAEGSKNTVTAEDVDAAISRGAQAAPVVPATSPLPEPPDITSVKE